MFDKSKLAERIRSIEGLSSDERSALLELLNNQKKYGLVWEEKPEEVEQQLQDQLPVLTEVVEKRIIGAQMPSSASSGAQPSLVAENNNSAPNHILIEGDNLHALTCLSYTHEGKIDVIYIDPPYNTGNKDFVYNDRFVDTEDAYRHSKWLSFMHKRLRIARRLLSDRGVIFISIGDNEQANLKLLCDEVFGEGNFVSQFIWHNNKKGRQMDQHVKTTNEYVLLYAKNINFIHTQEKIIEVNAQGYYLKDEISAYKKGYPLHNGTAAFHIENRPNLCYTIYFNPSTNEIVTIDEKVGQPNNWLMPISEKGQNLIEKGYVRILPKRNTKYNTQRVWRWGQEKINREKYDIFFVEEEGNWYPYQKERMEDNGTKNVKFTNYIDIDTSRGRNTLNELFNNRVVFDFPKPVELLCSLLKVIEGFTILDFFAGSGTTLHAVMQLNAEDGGHRQCILVTNNENGICENVTYERNRRVINGYTTPRGQQVEGLHNNNLRYYRTTFVPRERTQRNMRTLVNAATDLLCIQNDIYTEQKQFSKLRLKPHIARYFSEKDKHMLVVYQEEAAEYIAEAIKDMDFGNSKLRIYIFSPSRYAFDDTFIEVSGKVNLVALPAAIYDAYKRVLPKRKEKYIEQQENEQQEPQQTDLFSDL